MSQEETQNTQSAVNCKSYFFQNRECIENFSWQFFGFESRKETKI